MIKMTKRNALLLVSVPLICFAVVTIGWVWLPSLRQYSFHRNLKAHGIVVTAQIIEKGAVDHLAHPLKPKPGDKLNLKFRLSDQQGEEHWCISGVAKTVFEQFETGDTVQITYVKDDPRRCSLTQLVDGHLEFWRYSLIAASVLLGIQVILFAGALFFILRAYSGKSVELTTLISPAEQPLRCPECGEIMDEGYLPGMASIHWRDKGEPIGLPTMVSGLPGTVWWGLRRPKLHGYHCKKCNIIIFKYGKPSKQKES